MTIEHTIDLIENGADVVKTIRLTPVRAIRFHCLQCCAGQVKEIRECNIPRCALYPYRLGKRPKNENEHDEA